VDRNPGRVKVTEVIFARGQMLTDQLHVVIDIEPVFFLDQDFPGSLIFFIGVIFLHINMG
jgi:hypothetical protein